MIRINLFFAAFAALCVPSFAAQPQIWTVNSRADVMKGEARSVSIDQIGNITPAPKVTELFATEQPYIWSSAIDPAGNVYLGTGAEGRIYKIDVNGKGILFSDLNELNVTAIAIGKGGEIYAATSPDGKVYKLDGAGKASVYFEPKEKYIWSMVVMNDGALAVGTGDNGKLFMVKAAGATADSALFYDTSETHIITLAADGKGNLFAGTDSSGLVLRFSPGERPFALLDSPLREIHQVTIGPDGSVYVLALGETASTAKPSEPVVSSTPAAKTVTADAATPNQPPAPQKSRYDLTNAKSAVYRILPDGGTDVIWSSSTVIGFSIYPHQTGKGVLLGTSDRGRIYSIRNDGDETLVLQTDADQVSKIFGVGPNLYASTSNQGRLLKIGPSMVDEGEYESAILDAKSTAAWGSVWWNANGAVQIETRSGNSEMPNETWSGWKIVNTEARRGTVSSPAAQFFQWRAKLRGPAASLRELSLAFLARNIAPEITSFQVLPENVGLMAAPPVQIDPNIELTGLDPQAFGIVIAQQPPRRVYQRGARSFQWTSEDRNGDKVVYDIYFKERSDANFKPLSRDLEDNFITIDGLSLSDGRYTIKIVVKDSPSNPSGRSLSSEIDSEFFDIDNTQPTVAVFGTPLITGNRAKVVFIASDKSSYISRAEYSVNGGNWQTVYADDGISDGPDERYTVEIPVAADGEYSVTLRVFDANGNAGNGRAVIRR